VAGLVARLDDDFVARVEDVVRLTETNRRSDRQGAGCRENTFVRGSSIACKNFESLAPRGRRVPLLMEGVALTGAWVDKDRGLLSLIALELGVSSR